MYRYLARNAIRGTVRQARTYSTTRVQAPTRKFVVSAAAGTLLAMTLVGTTIANDVDANKVEKAKEVAHEQVGAVKEAVKGEGAETAEESPASGEGEASSEDHQGAAYNPETGEINWDCPCLGGMADGPCGEEFKEAFACFVYSETEPKGIDCIKKFEAMRTCFKQHPEHYKEELYDDDSQEELVDTSGAGEAVVAGGEAVVDAVVEAVEPVVDVVVEAVEPVVDAGESPASKV